MYLVDLYGLNNHTFHCSGRINWCTKANIVASYSNKAHAHAHAHTHTHTHTHTIKETLLILYTEKPTTNKK